MKWLARTLFQVIRPLGDRHPSRQTRQILELVRPQERPAAQVVQQAQVLQAQPVAALEPEEALALEVPAALAAAVADLTRDPFCNG